MSHIRISKPNIVLKFDFPTKKYMLIFQLSITTNMIQQFINTPPLPLTFERIGGNQYDDEYPYAH